MAGEQFKVHELVSFRLQRGQVEAQRPSDGATITFPTRFLPVLVQFEDWQELPSALARFVDKGADLATMVLFIREMIAGGILIGRSATAPTDRPSRASSWHPWGPALSYYLASRSRDRQPYISVADLDRRLEEKALTEPQPSAFKDYPGSPLLALPEPPTGAVTAGSVPEVLLRRRTHRAFSDKPLPVDDLSTLLYLTWGATHVRPNRMGEDVFVRKTSPSGGSLHPCEVYLLALNVADIAPGAYHYSVRRHGLELISGEDPHQWLMPACGGQEWVADCAAVFLSTGVVRRSAWKYQFARAFRYLFLDAGHVSQTFCLVATWLELAPFSIGALRDEIFETRLGLDFLAEPVLFANGVGFPADGG